MANHSEQEWEWKGERYICMPGQMITSLEKIAKTAGKGISIQNVRSAIERFQKYDFLTNESTKQSRLITICNYGSYQDVEDGSQQSSQQSANRRPTTNNNVNKDNNINIGDFDVFSFENVWALYERKGNKKTSLSRWNKLSKSKKQKALDHIPLYIQAKPDKQFRKDFQSYISQEVWNDELLTTPINNKKKNEEYIPRREIVG